ncbi:Hypothetical predicted protein [Olea europaea subsp. europaea]|uniref:Uncharacterized protein n=1 Tax=Olea europaea subsp. europaea TaxID=158383 RepID=A0A8S0TKV3_OLEEU|nr:Hypothetical predicted protein [Olea europaea subsp. europaea]
MASLGAPQLAACAPRTHALAGRKFRFLLRAAAALASQHADDDDDDDDDDDP